MGWRLFFERLAILDDPDAGQIRGHAITALIRAGERAERTVAPALAAASYVTAAELSSPGPADGTEAAASLWERAAQAEITNGSWAKVVASVNRLVPLGRTVTPPTARPAQASLGRQSVNGEHAR